MKFSIMSVIALLLLTSITLAQNFEVFTGDNPMKDLPKLKPENHLARCLANPDNRVACHLARTNKKDGGLESTVIGQLNPAAYVTCKKKGGVCLELATLDLDEKSRQASKVRLPSVDIAVLFDYDQNNIRSGETAKIAQIATALKHTANAKASFAVIGHTDARGTNGYNCHLSSRRANAVADRLVASGITSERLIVIGAGKYVLRNKKNIEAAENRRVGFVRLAGDQNTVLDRLAKLCAGD